MPAFDITNHFWIVGADETQVWSTALVLYVPVEEPLYLAWLEDGGAPTRIATEAELEDVLAVQHPAGWPTILPKAQARKELAASDVKALRCLEAGKPVPADLKAYRTALRWVAITGKIPDEGWPAKPAKPAAAKA